MATTKIHPIESTLKEALDYVENSDKTDGKLLVAFFTCSYETASVEFEMLLAQVYQKGNNLGHHLIQSFVPGEVTPEQAYEVGEQLAEEVLQGKYPYVLITRIDKDHVHNHITFHAVDMVNQHKYISNEQNYAYIRRTSDRLCKENGLSVVKPGQSKGKSYAERDTQRRGTSWKARLKAAIDATIPQAEDFDDLLRLMWARGYEIEPRKLISLRAPGQERFTRCKTPGEAYIEEAIKECTEDHIVTRAFGEREGTSSWVDLENDIRTQQSAGHGRWAKLHNLKQAAKTLNFLTEHGIDTYPDLESKVAEITATSDEAAATFRVMEHRPADMAVLIKNIFTYKQLRPVAMGYRNVADRTKFRCEHESTLILYEAAVKTLRGQGVKKLPDPYTLEAEYKRLVGEKKWLYEKRDEVKEQIQEYGIIKQDVDGVLRMMPEKKWTQEL